MSAEEDDYLSEGTEAPTAKRVRGKAAKWQLVQEFTDVPAFKIWIEDKQKTEGLVKDNITKGEVAEKRQYRCKCKRLHKCEYKLRAEFHRGESGVEVFWNGKEHQHLNRDTEGSAAGCE